MYRGKENETFHHFSTTSKLHESHNETLQKEVENYTRKFEEEKRRLFRIQQSHGSVFAKYKSHLHQLATLKGSHYIRELRDLRAKIKFLEIELEKGIVSYNNSLSKNNSLRSEIDELRKHRKIQIEAGNKLQTQICHYATTISQMQHHIHLKKEEFDKLKSSIVNIKSLNQEEAEDCIEDIEGMERNVKWQDKIKETIKNAQHKIPTEGSDSQPILRLRLKSLIHQNRERMKVIEQYRKSMQKIAETFDEIKTECGVGSLEEIANIFLTQEEQNKCIYEYINQLTNSLEMMKEEKECLKEKISKEEAKNGAYKELLKGTPEDKKREVQWKKFLRQKNQSIQDFNHFLKDIEPYLAEALDLGQNEELTFMNYSQKLGDLESLVNGVKPESSQSIYECDYSLKRQTTKYSKSVPWVNQEEMKEKNEECLMEEDKLYGFAVQFWEKKKLTK